MNSAKLKRAALQIETNRQRLQFAVETGNEGLQTNTLKFLLLAYSEYFDETKEALMSQIKNSIQNEIKFLVFSADYPDGVTLTAVELRNLRKQMTEEDRATHYVTQLDPGVSEQLEQAHVIPMSTKSSRKQTA